MEEQKTFVDKIIRNRMLSHILFWVTFLIVFIIIASLNSGSIKENFISHLSMLPSQIIAGYLLNYYQIPRLLFKKKYLLFIVSILLSIYILSAFARFSVVHIAEPFFRTDFEQESIKEIFTDAEYLVGVYFPVVYMYAFIMMIIKLIKRRFEEKHQLEILKKEKVTNELKFLRAQIQPHFLFNTLNNLYALTLAKSDVAPKVVLKLSELLDFILYQSNEKSISIQKEIELIKGFIDLEKLRFGNKIKVEFSHNIENKNAQISPLLLLPLVENAFKHGPTGNEKNAKIQIDLNVKNNTLNFEILNNKPIIVRKNNLHNGIGIKNLKRQLALNYKGNFKLEVEDLDDEYKVNLKIDLN